MGVRYIGRLCAHFAYFSTLITSVPSSSFASRTKQQCNSPVYAVATHDKGYYPRLHQFPVLCVVPPRHDDAVVVYSSRQRTTRFDLPFDFERLIDSWAQPQNFERSIALERFSGSIPIVGLARHFRLPLFVTPMFLFLVSGSGSWSPMVAAKGTVGVSAAA